MITRVALPLLLLPLIAVAWPLVYAMAWLREAVLDLRVQRVAVRMPVTDHPRLRRQRRDY